MAEHVAPGIGNLIAQHVSVAEARDRPFVALIRMCRVPGPSSAVALRVSDSLLRSRRSPLCLSFLSEVGFLKHCPRSSALCMGAFAVRALFQWWSASWWNALQFMVSQSPRKGLTQYDTADIALAIVVSTDTPGAPALAFSCSIITAALGIARASSALLSFARDLAITSSAGNSPVRGGEPLCVS